MRSWLVLRQINHRKNGYIYQNVLVCVTKKNINGLIVLLSYKAEKPQNYMGTGAFQITIFSKNILI